MYRRTMLSVARGGFRFLQLREKITNFLALHCPKQMLSLVMNLRFLSLTTEENWAAGQFQIYNHRSIGEGGQAVAQLTSSDASVEPKMPINWPWLLSDLFHGLLLLVLTISHCWSYRSIHAEHKGHYDVILFSKNLPEFTLRVHSEQSSFLCLPRS